MEKKGKVFSTKPRILFITFTLLIMSFYIGFSHGSRVDQAGRLRALRLAKRARRHQKGSPSYDDEQNYWTVEPRQLGSEVSFDDGGKMEDDLVGGGGVELPGQPSGVTFKQYAGYINVDELTGRSLFYYLVEAIGDPSYKPLVLWLNGGPGCSSLGMGALVEIGPFGVKPDGETLYSRRHSWNNVANVLFLESPAGVGFSYSNTTSDYSISGDKRTALDTYAFLINWFRRYPHYKTSQFYIAGESYAGFYIPELADTIINRNKEADSTSVIQLKGIMVGNGIINDATDQRGNYDYVWSHALISDETYRGLVEDCLKSKRPKKCEYYEERIGIEAGFGKIDFYSIYSAVCPHSTNSSTWKKQPKRHGGYDPCEGDYVHMYLNLPRVQQALHANITKLPYSWELCSDFISASSWKDSPSTMLPVYRRLIGSGLRILLYSGDTDAVVPVSGTRYAIDKLRLKVVKPWHPWSDETDEVSGYKVVYDGLTFTTVRDAGHQVPQFQPRRALALFKMYLEGEL